MSKVLYRVTLRALMKKKTDPLQHTVELFCGYTLVVPSPEHFQIAHQDRATFYLDAIVFNLTSHRTNLKESLVKSKLL